MSGRKKILFISHWSSELGGAEFSQLDIFSQSVNKFDTYLLTSEEGLFSDRAKDMGVNVIVENGSGTIKHITRYKFGIMTIAGVVNLLIYSFKCLKHINKIHPDCIYTNIPKSTIVVMLLKKFGFIKIHTVYHIRDAFDRKTIPYLAYKFLYNSYNSKIIAISEFIKGILPLRMAADTRVVYNGVLIPSKKRENVKKRRYLILYLGRVVPWKGIDFLVELFSFLNSRYPDKFKFSIVGGTDYWSKGYREDIIRKIKRSGLDSHCVLSDKTDDIAEIYSTHDIFVNASVDEPFGRVVAEALSFGLPVVAYNSGAMSEIIDEECGFLISEKNIELFADAIMKIISDDLIDELGTVGRAKVIKNFNKNIQIRKILELVENS